MLGFLAYFQQINGRLPMFGAWSKSKTGTGGKEKRGQAERGRRLNSSVSAVAREDEVWLKPRRAAVFLRHRSVPKGVPRVTQ
jgi:hypothetical protein